MTTANQALVLHTKLLVAEYGWKRVLAALAQAENVELETIEQEVGTIRERRSSSRRRLKKLPELLQKAEIDLKIFPLVERIAYAYENKRYLSELWRVRRFLESNGIDGSKVRSRMAAIPLVIQVLGNLCEKELNEIIEDNLNRSKKGDLGIIADQILGSPGDRPKSVNEPTAETSDPEIS